MSAIAIAGSKRYARSASSDSLLRLERGQQPGKRQETGKEAACHLATDHLLPPLAGESKAAYFARLGARLRRDIFSPASGFERDGIYLYKRPVRSGSGEKAALLAAGGSVFHHVVVYIKQGHELTALEFGPANQMDITDDLSAETPPAPVLLRPAPPPEPECLPMLHVAAPHHPLEAEHVQKALSFAESTTYHALRNNCICFADFAVRVLTGGAVKCAPLIFDLLVGKVPPVDSPLLALFSLTMQLSWHDVCDGGRLLRSFLQQHPSALLPLPGSKHELSLLQPESAAPQSAAQAVPAAVPAPQLPPALFGPLAAFLASSGLLPQQPAGSSSSSEDTCGVDVEEATVEAGASASSCGSRLATCPAASSGSSLATTAAASRAPKGAGLPPRAAKARRV